MKGGGTTPKKTLTQVLQELNAQIYTAHLDKNINQQNVFFDDGENKFLPCEISEDVVKMIAVTYDGKYVIQTASIQITHPEHMTGAEFVEGGNLEGIAFTPYDLNAIDIESAIGLQITEF